MADDGQDEPFRDRPSPPNPMLANSPPKAPSPTDPPRNRPRTWRGALATVAVTALFPLAMLAAAYPTVATTLLVAVGGVGAVVRARE